MINLLIQRQKLWLLFTYVVHDDCFAAAPQVEVFQPDQVALPLRPADDGLYIGAAGKDGGETKQVVRMPAL